MSTSHFCCLWLLFFFISKICRTEKNHFVPSAVGKLCLQHEDLAKKSVPALVRELEVCEDVAVRNNVVIVLCDLCIRYPVMVDKYIPYVAMCLKDSDPFIRKQTLILLTNLLQVRVRRALSFPYPLHPLVRSKGYLISAGNVLAL